jgi:hypothetical protein
MREVIAQMVDERLTIVGGTDAGDEPKGATVHQPTPSSIATVEAAAQNGVPQRAIAALIGVSINTLRKHYASQLVYGNARLQAAICQAQLNVARGMPAQYDERGNLVREETKPIPSMLMYLGKVHCGQRDGGIGQFESPTDEAAAVEFDTIGLSGPERTREIIGLLDIARARQVGRAAAAASAVGAVPRKPATNGSGEQS